MPMSNALFELTCTVKQRSLVEGLNGFVSMRTSVVVRHRNWSRRAGDDCRCVTSEELRLLFARGLRLRRRWRDVMDQLRVVLVHAPDVSAKTAIVRDSRVLARERQIFGGILPTRRTGRNQHVGTSLFSARTVPAEPSDFAPRCAPSEPLVGPKSWEAIPFVSLGGLHMAPPGDRGLHSVGNQVRDRCPLIRVSPRIGNSWVGWVQSPRGRFRTASR